MEPREYHGFFNQLSGDSKNIFRKFEKFSIKIINTRKAIRFNKNRNRVWLSANTSQSITFTKFFWYIILINRLSRKWSCTEFMKFFLFLLFFNNGRKNNFRNVTIFISYPMYFGALRTNINSKNQKKNIIYWCFWPQNCSFPPKSVS